MAHSDHTYYADKESLAAGDFNLRQCLNGEWQFCFSVNAGSRPEDFYREDYDRRDWDSIPVPMHIEMAGYDKIHYINVMYPWEGKMFRRPACTVGDPQTGDGSFSQASYNPVGSYVKVFDLDPDLRGKPVSICFEGVEQAMYLWLNGHFIGYAEDSFTPRNFS